MVSSISGGKTHRTYITVLPLANITIRSFRDQVVAVHPLVAAGQVRTGLEKLGSNELELTMVAVEVSMDLQLCRATHGHKLTSSPETSILIYENTEKR